MVFSGLSGFQSGRKFVNSVLVENISKINLNSAFFYLLLANYVAGLALCKSSICSVILFFGQGRKT